MPLAGSYLDIDGLKARAAAPPSLVDGSWIDPSGAFASPGMVARRTAWLLFVDSQLKITSAKVDARLRKRYAAPFSEPVSETVLGWVAALVTPKLYERRGWDPSDQQAVAVYEAAKTALEEMREAADAEVGLFDLPLREGTEDVGPNLGGPLGYSEGTPYEWVDIQRSGWNR